MRIGLRDAVTRWWHDSSVRHARLNGCTAAALFLVSAGAVLFFALLRAC